MNTWYIHVYIITCKKLCKYNYVFLFSCSGFHVIPPDPTKNAKLKESEIIMLFNNYWTLFVSAAQREEEDHRLHKEKQKERIRDQTSHPARVGKLFIH